MALVIPTYHLKLEANLGIAFIASSLQNLTIKGVVYRKLVEDFPKLEIALALY